MNAATRPAHRSVSTAPKSLTCAKCDGTGKILGFAHIADGVCFACGGTGRLAQDPKMTNAKWYRQRVSLARANAEICMDAAGRGEESRVEHYAAMLVGELFKLGTVGAREVLDHVAGGRWYDSHECAWRQLDSATASALRARIVDLGRECSAAA
jgi:hypothetical protein